MAAPELENIKSTRGYVLILCWENYVMPCNAWASYLRENT